MASNRYRSKGGCLVVGFEDDLGGAPVGVAVLAGKVLDCEPVDFVQWHRKGVNDQVTLSHCAAEIAQGNRQEPVFGTLLCQRLRLFERAVHQGRGKPQLGRRYCRCPAGTAASHNQGLWPARINVVYLLADKLMDFDGGPGTELAVEFIRDAGEEDFRHTEDHAGEIGIMGLQNRLGAVAVLANHQVGGANLETGSVNAAVPLSSGFQYLGKGFLLKRRRYVDGRIASLSAVCRLRGRVCAQEPLPCGLKIGLFD